MDLNESCAEDLDIFVRLSKAGDFSRALEFFDTYLSKHRFLFPVAAGYVDVLIDQGAFHDASSFLGSVLQPTKDYEATCLSMSEDEPVVLKLLETIVNIHLKLCFKDAILEVRNTLARFEIRPIESLSPVQVRQENNLQNHRNAKKLQIQTLILSLRVFDLTAETLMPFDVPVVVEELHGLLPMDREQFMLLLGELIRTWNLWEAQTLLSIHLRQILQKALRSCITDVMSLIEAVPHVEDSMVALAVLTMISTCCEVLVVPENQVLHHYWLLTTLEARSKSEAAMVRTQYHRAQKMRDAHESQDMDLIDDKIAISRACRML
jgi:hypothetical protein